MTFSTIFQRCIFSVENVSTIIFQGRMFFSVYFFDNAFFNVEFSKTIFSKLTIERDLTLFGNMFERVFILFEKILTRDALLVIRQRTQMLPGDRATLPGQFRDTCQNPPGNSPETGQHDRATPKNRGRKPGNRCPLPAHFTARLSAAPRSSSGDGPQPARSDRRSSACCSVRMRSARCAASSCSSRLSLRALLRACSSFARRDAS